MEEDLLALIDTIQNEDLRTLLDRLIAPGGELWERFRDAPAAKHFHQAYRHGRLEHTLSVAQGASAAASSLQETVASLEELTTMVGQNSKNAVEASELAAARDFPVGVFPLRFETAGAVLGRGALQSNSGQQEGVGTTRREFHIRSKAQPGRYFFFRLFTYALIFKISSCEIRFPKACIAPVAPAYTGPA